MESLAEISWVHTVFPLLATREFAAFILGFGVVFGGGVDYFFSPFFFSFLKAVSGTACVGREVTGERLDVSCYIVAEYFPFLQPYCQKEEISSKTWIQLINWKKNVKIVEVMKELCFFKCNIIFGVSYTKKGNSISINALRRRVLCIKPIGERN